MGHRDYEAAIVAHLRQRRFVLEPGDAPGEYVVTAQGAGDLPLRPRLCLDNQLLTEYLAAMSADCQHSPDPLLEALSLAKIHAEEELDTVDIDGRNHATALGVRRDAQGRVVWFAERETPGPAPAYLDPPEDLVWQADPPR